MTIRAWGKHGLWFWMLTSLLNFAASQRDGYVSIDCGATVNSTDFLTGIEWVADAAYISTGIIADVEISAASGIVNQEQLRTLRYFSVDRSKHCYTLPASMNSSYLLRAMFLHGSFQPETDNTFYLSIDSNIVDYLEWAGDNYKYAWYLEYIFAATSDHITFCLLPSVGNPFISTLELRPLAAGMYDVVHDGRYLKSISRLNCGVVPDHPVVRYPDDIYD